MAADSTEEQKYADVRISYKNENNELLPNTKVTVIPMPIGTVVNWAAPKKINQYEYINKADGLGESVKEDGLDITYYYREGASVPPKTEFTIKGETSVQIPSSSEIST